MFMKRPSFDARLAQLLPELTALRQDIHAHPELGYKEVRTAGIVAAWLKALPGMQVRTGVAGTGVVATLAPSHSGPCIALRAEMDALPMNDGCGRPHASKHPGVAHTCGHDGHTACLLGAARLLAEAPDELAGPVRFIFQPAEEGGGGGRLMVEQGALDDPTPAAIFALHAWLTLKIGTVGMRSGPVMASTDTIDIAIHGRGAHAAMPNKGVDPIVAAAHVVVALQTAVSRLTDQAEPTVVTIGTIAGGSARNIIPERVILSGTLRTLSETQREAARRAIRQVAERTAEAFGARAEVTLTEGYPVNVNDAAAVDYLARVAAAELGGRNLRTDLPPSMGGEDFAYYLKRLPGAFWRLGVAPVDGSPTVESLHHPAFDFPDAALATGVRMHCALARNFAGFVKKPVS